MAVGVLAGLGGSIRFSAWRDRSDLVRIDNVLASYGPYEHSFGAWVNAESVNGDDDNRLFIYKHSDGAGSWFAITFDDTDEDNIGIEATRFGTSVRKLMP